jgi:hypothetical protein
MSIGAAVFTAVYKVMDNYTVHNLITNTDGLTAAFAYLIVGGWVGLILGGVFSILLGKKLIDPDFNGLVITNGKMQLQAIISGVISAGSTLFLLWGNQYGDPSVMIALGCTVILYTAMYDLVAKQAKLSVIAWPLVLVLGGSMLSAYGGSIRITAMGLLLVLVVSNGLAAISEIVEQRGARASDGVNFFFWRFFWLATSGTLIALVTSSMRGQTEELVTTIQSAIRYIPWVGATMFFVFLGIGMKITAKKNGAVSVVLMVLSYSIVIGYIITVAIDTLLPGTFGQSQPASVWIIRAFGAMTLTLGLLKLRGANQK